MSSFLEKLRYKFYHLVYSTKTKVEHMSNRTANLLLSFTISLIAIGVGYMVIYSLQPLPETPATAVQKKVTAKEIVDESKDMITNGNPAESFEYLATQLNRFNQGFSKKEKLLMEIAIDELLDDSYESSIFGLYKLKDLTSKYDVMKFSGVIVASDNDALYGSTSMVAESRAKSKYQLEVTGLNTSKVGKEVTFYGVPKFTGVDTPIKVEAYQPKKKEVK